MATPPIAFEVLSDGHEMSKEVMKRDEKSWSIDDAKTGIPIGWWGSRRGQQWSRPANGRGTNMTYKAELQGALSSTAIFAFIL